MAFHGDFNNPKWWYNGDISGYMVLRPDEIATLLEWDLDWVFNSPTFQVVELPWFSPAQRLLETSGPEVCCRGSVFDATAQAFTKAFYRVADAQFGVPEFFIPWSHEKWALAPWIWFGKAFEVQLSNHLQVSHLLGWLLWVALCLLVKRFLCRWTSPGWSAWAERRIVEIVELQCSPVT